MHESWHWDGDIPAVFMDSTDIVITIPRAVGKRNDELWYDRESDILIVWDYNHPSGIPHVIALKRGGELPAWTHVSVMRPRVFNFVASQPHSHPGKPSYPTHKCTIDLERLKRSAQRLGVFFDWMPIDQFTTSGQVTILPSDVWEQAAHGDDRGRGAADTAVLEDAGANRR
jgi:hypothetical protein